MGTPKIIETKKEELKEITTSDKTGKSKIVKKEANKKETK